MVANQVEGAWFTGVRVERLAGMLSAVPSRHTARLTRDNATRLLFAVVGCSHDEIQECLDVLEALKCIDSTGGYARTPDGDKIARALKREDRGTFTLALLRSGVFADQIRHILSISSSAGDALTFPPSDARRGAAQLLGLLSGMPDFDYGPPCQLRGALREELESVWNLGDPVTIVPEFVTDRQRVGLRAERYSLQLEWSRHVGAVSDVQWVAPDAPELGYDIEIRRPETRRVEVKGSRALELSFVLSDNEWRAANRYGPSYEIYYWADLRLNEPEAEGYLRLRSMGYPRIIRNPALALTLPPYTMTPEAWRVRETPAKPAD
jgi:hypothetical protein